MLLGELAGYYPVAGWLRVVCAYLQRCTARENIGWDEVISERIKDKINCVKKRLTETGDPVKGRWCVKNHRKMTVWADASSIELGGALEKDGDIIEDAAWLRFDNDSAHINRPELEAVIKGINMAIRWNCNY